MMSDVPSLDPADNVRLEHTTPLYILKRDRTNNISVIKKCQFFYFKITAASFLPLQND